MIEAIVASVFEKTGNLKLTHDEAKKILFSLTPDSKKLKDTETGYNLKKEEILEMISPVWERLARQVDLTLKTSSIENQRVEKIYILSSVDVDDSILNYMSDQLGTKAEFFDPFGRQKSNNSMEHLSVSEGALLSPALGFSLSDNRLTPNVIFTYHEKNRETNTKRINRVVFLAFLAALMTCLVLLIYQGSKWNFLKEQRIKLEKELALYNPLLSKEELLKASNELNMKKKITRQYAQRYWGLAAIGEVSDLTPQNISLISFKMTEGSVAPKTDADKTSKETNEGVLIEGIISGNRNMLDSSLAQYVMKLENSPMFNHVSIQKNSIITFKKSEVLHFILSAKIG